MEEELNGTSAIEAFTLSEPGTIKFNIGTTPKPILTIDKEGFVYLGKRITDAGEAYTAWMETMAVMKNENWETI
jgi:hypothetical protein